MRFLRHITVTLFVIGIFAFVIIIISSFLEKRFQTAKFKRPSQPTGRDLYPDSITLLDLWHFQYIINNDVCTSNENTSVTAALIITSHAGDVEGRNAIRLAYPTDELNKLGIRRVFLLALINSQKKDNKYKTVSQSVLINENERYSDLVQGNFYEAYRNLTYKHVMGLQWAVRYCKEAQFIIKMDDDIIVDFYRLLDQIKLTEFKEKELLMGYVLQGMQPIRDKNNKWFVTYNEFSKTFYPSFLSGWMYVTTPKTADKLLQASKGVRFFWIDDTYITGILAKVAGIKHKDISNIFTVHPEFLECCLDISQKTKLVCDFTVGPSGDDYDLLLRFKKYAAICNEQECPKREANKALNKTCISKGKPLPLGKGKAKVEPYNLI